MPITKLDAGERFIREDLAAVEQLIADVLGREHRMAEAVDEPDDARTILRLAHAFADELARANPRFDRLRFIQAATNEQPEA